MYKKFIRILCYLLAFIILFSTCVFAAATDNQVSLSVDANIAIVGAYTTVEVKMSVEYLRGNANVIYGTLSIADSRFDVSVSADYPNASAIYNAANGNFSLFTTDTFADAAAADLMTINLTLKPGELLVNGDTVSVILNSIGFQYTVDTIPCTIVNNIATTTFSSGYSTYDLNKDGVVDLHDISFALQYLMVKSSDPEWDDAYICDVHADGLIDIDDLILILANYTVPYYI